eukprot:TRINITY_DN27731_c0_g1_i1.p1 TRINITY_DN27731_c0_g1~~TRINITY_DN27731_c0_g1_i1.p1  ORF type:complete len:392 (-),score=68.38 TRINITY_DN27731_c0_g1_i1:107-1213(-)
MWRPCTRAFVPACQLRIAPSRLQLVLALRSVSVSAAQRKLRQTSYDGANTALRTGDPAKTAEKMASRGPQSERDPVLAEATFRIRDCTRLRQYEEALEVFRQVQQPDGILCSAALNACAKALKYTEAQEIWSSMKSEWKSVVGYSTMIDLCRRLRKVGEAEAFFAEMRAAGLEPNVITYNSLIGVYGMVGQHHKAVETFEKIRHNLLPQASEISQQMCYTAVMSAVARVGDYAKAREYFVAMTEAGVKPNHTHFNTLLTSCAKCELADHAHAILQTMPQWGLEPRIEDYTALLMCCRHDLPRCKGIFEEIRKAGLFINGLTYVTMLEAYVLGRDAPGARTLLEEADAFLDKESTKVKNLLFQLGALPQ